jgi:cytidyltransferase-like protein
VAQVRTEAKVMAEPSALHVACCGSYDYLLHDDHKRFLSFARGFGDRLVVFVTDDQVIRKTKGRTPYFTQEIRVRNLLAVEYVTDAIPLRGHSEEEDQNDIVAFSPDVFVFGAEQLLRTWDLGLRDKLFIRGITIITDTRPRILSTTEFLRNIGYIK